MLELEGHTGRVLSLAYSPDGQTLASAGYDSTIRLWDIPSGQCRFTLSSHHDCVYGLWFGADGTSLISGGLDDCLFAHTLKKWVTSRQLPGDFPGGVYTLAFCPRNSLVAVGTGTGTMTTFPFHRPGQARRYLAHVSQVSALAWSPDGKTLASASLDRTLKLWDSDWMRPRFTLPGLAWVRCLAWSPDGTLLAFGNDEGLVQLLDSAGRRVNEPLRGHTNRISSVSFSEDGSRLISAGWDGTLRTWAIPEGRLLDVRDWGLGRVGTLALSPNRMTAAAGMENTVLVWDTDGSGI